MTTDTHTLFDDLYRAQRGPLLRMARARLRLTDSVVVEDIVDKVFMRFWETLLGGELPEDPVAYLTTKVQNEARNERARTVLRWGREIPMGAAMHDLEERTGYHEDDLTTQSNRAVWPVGRALTPDDIEFQEAFDLALRSLDEPERNAFILTELRGLTVRDTGSLLGISPSTVSRHARAAQALIREELTNEEL